MHGMIHKALRELAIEKAGEDAWREIAAKCKLDSEHFISGQYYSDDITNEMIDAVAAKLGVDVETLLREFGRYWMRFAQNSSYSGVLDMAGDDLVTFLGNLDRMFAAIKAAMPKAIIPSFNLKAVKSDEIVIAYASQRKGLTPFIAGFLEGVLERFGEKGEISNSPRPGGAEFRIKRVSAKRVA